MLKSFRMMVATAGLGWAWQNRNKIMSKVESLRNSDESNSQANPPAEVIDLAATSAERSINDGDIGRAPVT